MPADVIRCEKIHSLPCQRCRDFANSGIYPGCVPTVVGITSGLVREDGCNVGKPSHLHAFVGAVEGQYVGYYWNIVLKWEE